MIALHDGNEPNTFNEALTLFARYLWMKAMEEEIESIKVNQFWDLIDLLPNRRAIENKWVLRIKHKVDGIIKIYKTILVAKGYNQKEGVGCKETFSPIIRFASIWLILAIFAHLDSIKL